VATANEETLPAAINFVIAPHKAKPQHPYYRHRDAIDNVIGASIDDAPAGPVARNDNNS
jgi:hypothetical protein